MKKRLLAILLALAMTVSLLAFPVSAETYSGTCGDNLTWELTEDGTLTISGTGDMEDYSSGTTPWYSYIDEITSIIVESGVTSIGNYAFSDCTWVTSVVIEEGVQIIGDSAFSFIGDYMEHTSALTEIVIPEGVTYIGDFAFYHIYQLESITLPESLTYIGEAAFTTDVCFELAYDELVIPANVSYIGPIAFMGANLTSITFEGDAPEILVPEVYESAIVSNPSILGGVEATVYYYSDTEGWTDEFKASLNTSGGELTFVELTREVQSESTAEEGSTGDTEDVSLAFSDVSSSEYYYDAVLWAVENGVTTGTSSTTFSPDSACTRAQVVTFLYRAAGEPSVSGIENPFTDVSSGDYYYSAVLWAVENGITTGTTASTFSPEDTCTRGQVVTFLYRYAGTDVAEADNPFTDVSSSEYYYNAVLWAVENGVTTGTTTSTFSPENSCTRAHVVTFLYRALSEEQDEDTNTDIDTDTSTDTDTDRNTSADTNTDTNMDTNADTNMDTDNSISADTDTVTDTSTDTDRNTSADTDRNTSADTDADTDENTDTDADSDNYDDSVIAAGTCGDDLTWVLTGDGTLTISGTGAMTNWTASSSAPWDSYVDSIIEVEVEDGVTSIGSWAFYQYTNLTSVKIGSSVTSIGDSAFRSTSLVSVTIPDSVTSIGDSAFRHCTNLVSVTIPDSVTSIGDSAFWYCPNLTNVTIPDSVTSIGDLTFEGCSSLTSVKIGSSVTSIGSWTFAGCTGLTSIIIPDSVTSIGDYAFYRCSSLTDIYYTGSEDDWAAISIGSNNTYLTSATIHYNYTG